ncbi:pre-mRNA-splicing factor CWC25 homolog isoform X1 [Amyelois transitella]|uniref:pre-mRNA-splicing factor CWC25 homolog isoform X1 n=1 Tax=Amyelois transitella TaxID=680683 RepID=UPI00298FD497|nr:pre-mRNA-splicing factor CWC25 homolog isoform X1 [Amyelois transitella]
MGGGDLNSKKSWHPNTMKNQERVWKAEQAAAQEKKRIQELQKEHAEERDRFELNNMIKQNASSASGSNNNRLHWMYDKPDKKVQQEDYLLGKSIEKNYNNVEKQEQDVIPAVARRVVGSSMLSIAGDSQVDLARKLREDPLLLVKERERAARAALLNNPLQRRRLTQLLRKEQEQNKDHKSKKKTKRDKDLDKQLAAKLNALGSEKGFNLATLLASDSSDTDSLSSEEEKSKKKKHKHDKTKKKQKKRKKDDSLSGESSDDDKSRKDKRESKEQDRNCTVQEKQKNYKESKKRKSDKDSSDCESRHKKSKICSSDKHRDNRNRSEAHSADCDKRQLYQRSEHSIRVGSRYERETKGRSKGMSSEERATKLAEMAAAGAERELSRGQRVAAQRAAAERSPRPAAGRAREVHALPDSLEARIHSNRHYIQRGSRHMDEHFARR